jgi:hypothetical protein
VKRRKNRREEKLTDILRKEGIKPTQCVAETLGKLMAKYQDTCCEKEKNSIDRQTHLFIESAPIREEIREGYLALYYTETKLYR